MLNHYINNFDKIKTISSDLLWQNHNRYLNKILISILIVTYKRKNMLKDAIESVKKQIPVNYAWELVILDNDPDSLLFDELDLKSFDVGVRYYRNKENVGHAGNLNRGVELCKGEWVCFLHDDDLLVYTYLNDIVKYINKARKWKKPLAYIRTNHKIFTSTEDLPSRSGMSVEKDIKWFRSEKRLETLLRGCGPTYVNSCGSLVNREIFMKIGGYNDDFYPIGDAILGIVLMNRGYSIASTESVMGYYRMDGNESKKSNVIIEFIRADFGLREFLYNKNFSTRCFGSVFRGAQFTNSVNVKMKVNGVKLGKADWKEINNIYLYKKRIIRVNILKLLSVVISGVIHPNTIINRIQIKNDFYRKDN